MTFEPGAPISSRFKYYQPKGDQADRYIAIRSKAFAFATYLEENCPQSRERSLAITKLEEAVMWANASIARNE